jgi:hypothetical protein
MKRIVILVGLAGAVFVPSAVVAQSPSPASEPRALCITVTGTGDTVTPETLTLGIADGSITIATVEDSCPASTGPEPSLAPAADAPLPLVVTDSGFTRSDDRASYAVIVSNPNPSTWAAGRVPVRLDFVDADGGLVTTEEAYVSAAPGQTTAITGSASDVQGAKKMEVVLGGSTDNWEELDFVPGTLTFSEVKTKKDTYGGLTTTGRIHSEFADQMESVEIIAVYKNKAGKVLGGASTYVDFIPAGGDSSFKINSFSDIKGVSSTEMYFQ